MISLAQLAEVATGSATRAGATPVHMMSIEEARAAVIVKDGNKKPAEDGSQKLTVVLGKYTLPLECIKAGTTRLAVTAEQVEGYSEALLNAVTEGLFDEQIVKAQGLAKAQSEKVKAKAKAPVVEAADTEGLDLDALSNESADNQAEVAGEEVAQEEL